MSYEAKVAMKKAKDLREKVSELWEAGFLGCPMKVVFTLSEFVLFLSNHCKYVRLPYFALGEEPFKRFLLRSDQNLLTFMWNLRTIKS